MARETHGPADRRGLHIDALPQLQFKLILDPAESPRALDGRLPVDGSGSLWREMTSRDQIRSTQQLFSNEKSNGSWACRFAENCARLEYNCVQPRGWRAQVPATAGLAIEVLLLGMIATRTAPISES